MGIAAVACLTAKVAWLLPVTMTSGLEPNQLVRKQGVSLVITIRISVDDVDVPALDVTEVLQSLREATHITCGSCRRSRAQDSNKRPPGRNLGDDGTWPRECRTTNKPNALPPLHSTPRSRAECREPTSSQRTPHRVAASQSTHMGDGCCGSDAIG